jgi:hypothetical protein
MNQDIDGLRKAFFGVEMFGEDFEFLISMEQFSW